MSMECEKKKAPIGVFDSGVGGLTVVREITRQLPHENIVYFGDTARVPYGSKSRAILFAFLSRSSVFSKQNRSKPLSLPAIRQVHWLWMLFGMNLIFQSLV